MSEFPKSGRSTVKRVSKRASYNKETVYQILDAGYVCHVSFVVDHGQPVIIPMAYGREGNTLYLHGSIKSRLQEHLAGGIACCLSVTHMDGLVLSRSAFDHSMNYRSVVVFGNAKGVEDVDGKRTALKVISDHLIPGRWDEVRQPNKKELKATSVAAVSIEEASAKIRSGPPKDNRKDLELPVWAGVIPFETTAKNPVPDPVLDEGIKPGKSVRNFEIKK